MSRDKSVEYWRLVEQLMSRGWYRNKDDPDRSAVGQSWGFRKGHVVDAAGTTEVRVEAASEVAAMRILLDELNEESDSRKSGRESSAGAPDQNRPD